MPTPIYNRYETEEDGTVKLFTDGRDSFPRVAKSEKMYVPSSTNGAKLVNAIRWIAMERPTHKVKECVYINERTGDPECLVGTALHRLGWLNQNKNWFEHSITKTMLPNFNSTQFKACMQSNYIRDETGNLINMSLQDMEWIREVQRSQDGGDRWYDAVVKADITNEDMFPARCVLIENYMTYFNADLTLKVEVK